MPCGKKNTASTASCGQPGRVPAATSRSRSWQAFWQTAVDGRPAAEVARALGVTVGTIYTARGRLLARIRKEIDH